MAKTGLEIKIIAHIATVLKSRSSRELSIDHRVYLGALENLTRDVKAASKLAKADPEMGLRVARDCIRFTMLAMPDSIQMPGRATALNQCQVLEDCLAKVRKPKQYLKEMKLQFGPNLDPRSFPTSQDAFHSIIKSQRNKISAEAKGLNSAIEEQFCLTRSELLRELERGYSLLRDQALGILK